MSQYDLFARTPYHMLRCGVPNHWTSRCAYYYSCRASGSIDGGYNQDVYSNSAWGVLTIVSAASRARKRQSDDQDPYTCLCSFGVPGHSPQLDFAEELEPHFHAPGPLPSGRDGGGGAAVYDDADRLFPAALALALSRPHVMSSTRERLVESVFSLLERGVALVLEYNEGHPDFPMPGVGFLALGLGLALGLKLRV